VRQSPIPVRKDLMKQDANQHCDRHDGEGPNVQPPFVLHPEDGSDLGW
jgi:hypothetical protein